MPKRQGKRGRKTRSASSQAPNSGRNFAMLSIARPMRSDPVYTVTRKLLGLAVATSSTSIETFSSNGITLGSFPGYANLTASFDQYRIDVVEFEYLPRFNTSDGSFVSNPGVFASVVDFDDVNNLGSFAAALEYPNSQVWTPSPGKNNLLRHRFVPRIAVAAYAGAFTSYANTSKIWIDTASPSVAHYGVKTAWTPTSSALIMDLMISATISFRGAV